MSLDRMSLTGYRCFVDRQDIELLPVTVVLGRNNSGKSALVRAPLVLETGIRNDSHVPLDLDGLDRIGEIGVEMVDSFVDLVNGHRPHGSIRVGIELGTPSGPVQLDAVVQNVDEVRTQVVSRLELRSEVAHAELGWEGDLPSAGSGRTGRYTVTLDGRSWPGVPVGFAGLLPRRLPEHDTGVPHEAKDRLLALGTAIRTGFPTIRYVGPFRDRPQRRYKLPTRMPTSVGSSGEHTAGVLVDDAVREGGRLLNAINERLVDELSGWQVAVEDSGALYSVVLVSQDDPTLRVNLADTGTGIAQELPIIVQRVMDEMSPPTEPVLEIVEQPELHLHPAAHSALATQYLDAARRSSVQFLVETHSETFVLRLRRLIAEGKCDPAMVALYFVEHLEGTATARRITIADDGTLDYWPEGVFAEDYAETRAIVNAQLTRGHGAG